ncbi:MAG: dihydrolipoyl dehydrogenase [Alistipes sp.]
MRYDIIVIGSGPGGYVAAIRASQLGKKVAIVERAETGGVCLNWGCIPTKALLKSAQVYTYCTNAAHYGLEVGEVRPDLEKIVARSRGVAETMSKGVQFLLKKNNIDLINGFGKLKGDGKVDVDGTIYEAEHIVLATGARSREMPFMRIDGEHIISSKQALTLTKLPASMIVVGSGAIGSEFAYLYAALGTKVTIVEYLPQMMPLEDEEVSKTMERSFRKLRATVLTSTTVKAVRVNNEGKCEVDIEGKKGAETLTSDVVLSAVGIKSNIENIGLEELGITVERDKIAVDKFYHTNVAGIYAIGDIVGGPALAHVASAEAICCIEAICGLTPTPIDYTTIPSCVYTSPEVASVGMTEQEAQKQGLSYKVGRFPFTASGKATAAGDRDGFVKLLFGEDDKLLGAHFVGANVTEMIAEPTLARTLGATAHQLARTIHSHPTMNEGVMEAAEAAFGAAIHL